jgi:catechol 2,3-dioxygenase-like lactoylglutathione lyase family enzyme
MSEATALRVSDVLCVAIPVSDQDEALDFYVGVLGCEKYADEQVGDGFRWVEVRPHGSGVGIALLARRRTAPQASTPASAWPSPMHARRTLR